MSESKLLEEDLVRPQITPYARNEAEYINHRAAAKITFVILGGVKVKYHTSAAVRVVTLILWKTAQIHTLDTKHSKGHSPHVQDGNLQPVVRSLKWKSWYKGKALWWREC